MGRDNPARAGTELYRPQSLFELRRKEEAILMRGTVCGPALALVVTLLTLPSAAPGSQQEARANDIEPAQKSEPTPALAKRDAHPFWDKTNLLLFGGVAAVRTLDYTSTRYFRARGVNEALLTNSIVDNKPLFIAIQVGTAAASVGLAYVFHRTGHHKLERWVSIVHISVGGFGSARNYTKDGTPPSSLPR